MIWLFICCLFSKFSSVHFFLCCLRLACWQCVRIGISSWPKTSKKLTRPSSRKTSRSTSSTSRHKIRWEKKQGAQTHTCLLLIYVCVSVSTVGLLWICSPWPALISGLNLLQHKASRHISPVSPALRRRTTTWWSVCTGTLLVLWNIWPWL